MNPYVRTTIVQKGTPTYLRTVQHGKLNGFGKKSFATMTKTVFFQTDILTMTYKYNRLIQIKNIPNKLTSDFLKTFKTYTTSNKSAKQQLCKI